MKKILDSFQENGATYYRLCVCCPVCLGRGVPTPTSYWTHSDNNCNGDVYVGDNAYYKCTKCGRSAHVLEWKCSCPTHSNSPDNFIGAGAVSSATEAVTIAGQLVEVAGITWLQSFLANWEKFWVERKQKENTGD